MLITPQDIVDKAFSTKLRQGRSDEFLDKIYITKKLVRNKDETERYIKD